MAFDKSKGQAVIEEDESSVNSDILIENNQGVDFEHSDDKGYSKPISSTQDHFQLRHGSDAKLIQSTPLSTFAIF